MRAWRSRYWSERIARGKRVATTQETGDAAAARPGTGDIQRSRAAGGARRLCAHLRCGNPRAGARPSRPCRPVARRRHRRRTVADHSAPVTPARHHGARVRAVRQQCRRWASPRPEPDVRRGQPRRSLAAGGPARTLDRPAGAAGDPAPGRVVHCCSDDHRDGRRRHRLRDPRGDAPGRLRFRAELDALDTLTRRRHADGGAGSDRVRHDGSTGAAAGLAPAATPSHPRSPQSRSFHW